MFNRSLFSSQRLDWQTPKAVYDALDAEFHFDFDPCPHNPTFDGLAVEWGWRTFCNPCKDCGIMVMCQCDCHNLRPKSVVVATKAIHLLPTISLHVKRDHLDLRHSVKCVERQVGERAIHPRDASLFPQRHLVLTVENYIQTQLNGLDPIPRSAVGPIHGAEVAPGIMQNSDSPNEEPILLGVGKSSQRNVGTTLLLRASNTSDEVQKSTTTVADNGDSVSLGNGRHLIGNTAKRFGALPAPIVEIVANLPKITLFPSAILLAQGQFPGTWCLRASSAIAQSNIGTPILGLETQRCLLQSERIYAVCDNCSRDTVLAYPTNVFCNPPYGKEIGKWVKKAWEEYQKGRLVVMLIPSRTDTIWWHSYVMKATEIRFIKGRLKFDDHKQGAPFPSAIIVFGSCSHE